MSTPQGHDSHKTVLELDLAAYSDIASALEENLDVEAVKTFQDQIQSFVDVGLNELGLHRDEVVFATAGDNALLIFDEPAVMHKFAKIVQEATAKHNSKKSVESAKRWFRMGAATGAVLLIPAERRIVGTTVARAVRLEAAADKGELLVDTETFEGLPQAVKILYGPEEVVAGKRDEHFTVRRIALISPAAHLEKLQGQSKPAAKPAGAPAGGLGWKAVLVIVALAAAMVVFYFHTLGLEKRDQIADAAVKAQAAMDAAKAQAAADAAKQQAAMAAATAQADALAQQKAAEAAALPKTLVVPDQFTNIESAVRAARAGDTVSVKAGIYEGAVSMKSGVKLIGEGKESVTLRAPATKIVLSLNGAKDAFVSNLTIEHEDKLPADAKTRYPLVDIGNGSTAELSDCRVQNGDGHGIYIFNSSPKISGCQVRWNGWNGIEITGPRSQPAVAHNQMTENRENGILISGGAAGTLEGNECSQNNQNGCEVMGAETAPDLKGNACLNNRLQGMLFSRGTASSAEDNKCSQNGANGIMITDAGPTLRGNQCLENTLCGMRFIRQSSGDAEQNNCSRNKKSGIAVYGDSAPKIHANNCRENAEWGIWCQITAKPDLGDNKMTGNPNGPLVTNGTVNGQLRE